MQKPTLALVGFWARGNLGDEAILQGICRALGPHFNFLLVVSEHGAYKDYRKWYPYNTYEVTDISNLSRLTGKDITGVLVGGGGLGMGFGADQVCMAKGLLKKTALVGVDMATLPTVYRKEDLEPYYNLFDYTSFRSHTSFQLALGNGIQASLGTDWVFCLSRNLRQTNLSSFSLPGREILVVIREWPLNGEVLETHVQDITNFLKKLEKQTSAKIIICPFSPEDFRILQNEFKHLPYNIFYTHSVEKMLIKFAESGMVFSFGRLHPLIFAKICSVPSVSIQNKSIPSPKLTIMSEELGCHLLWENELYEFSLADIPNPTSFSDEMVRLNQQINDLVNLFSGQKVHDPAA